MITYHTCTISVTYWQIGYHDYFKVNMYTRKVQINGNTLDWYSTNAYVDRYRVDPF